jgi:hypothetical protein
MCDGVVIERPVRCVLGMTGVLAFVDPPARK